MHNARVGGRAAVGIGVALLTLASSCSVMAQAGAALEEKGAGVLSVQSLSLLVLVLALVMLGAFASFIFTLQRRYLETCVKEHRLDLFAQSPAGLPTGTIRSMLAMMIVSLTLFFILISFLGVLNTGKEIPETLTAILGTVIGFYFGSRSGGAVPTGGEDKETNALRTTQAQAAEETDNTLDQARKVVQTGRLLTSFLPKEWAGKVESVTAQIESGIDKVEQLKKVGDALGAMKEGARAAVGNPLAEMFTKASTTFATVLGSGVPQYALIAALVGLAGRYTGTAYQKWKSRILHAPFSPAVVRLDPIDSNTGFALISASPLLMRVFQKELTEGDNPALASFANKVIKADTLAHLWQKLEPEVRERFESQAQFVEAMEGLRRAVVDQELQRITPRDALPSELEGYTGLMRKVDALYADPECEAQLHALFITIERLQKEGKSAELQAIVQQLQGETA